MSFLVAFWAVVVPHVALVGAVGYALPSPPQTAGDEHSLPVTQRQANP